MLKFFNKIKNKYILFINDTENDYHFGCSATSLAIKNEIKKLFNNMPIKTISVIDIWSAKNPPKNEKEFFSRIFFKNYIKSNKDIIKLIKNCHEIFINGEGTILGFENRVGTQNLLYLINVAKYFKKKISLINHSCFPCESCYLSNSNYNIYKSVYTNLNRCVVRDMRSLAILNSYGCTNVTLGFDCSPLYIQNTFSEKEIPYNKGEYICISGGIEFANHFENFLDNYIEELHTVFKKQIVFLMSNTNRKADDDLKCIKFIENFNKKSQHKCEIFYAQSTDEFITFIKNAYFQITGRFHHSIIATFLKTKYLVLSTHSPKNKIFQDLAPNCYVDIDILNNKTLFISKIKKIACGDFPIKYNQDKILKLAQNNFIKVESPVAVERSNTIS